MNKRAQLLGRLRLPVIASPMFLVSGVDLVIAQCKAGVVGSFPVLNARPQAELANWLTRIETELDAHRRANPEAVVAPYAVNLIVAPSNERLEADLEVCIRHRVPIVITSLGAPTNVVHEVHAYGGMVLHDVTQVRHARKAIEAGVDGLILVAAGAGGHAGVLSPFALACEIRQFYDGMLVLAGAITRGCEIRAAQIIGCDAAYVGTTFIATTESAAPDAYKRMIVDATAADIAYTPFFSGVPANYLVPSIRGAGLDPLNLAPDAGRKWGSGSEKPKAWKDIWGAGQGVGGISAVVPVADVVDRLEAEYRAALETPAHHPGSRPRVDLPAA